MLYYLRKSSYMNISSGSMHRVICNMRAYYSYGLSKIPRENSL